MKKILIAGILTTMVGAASATETASVNVYGKMRIYQESYKAGTAGSLTQQTNSGSRLGFKGKEDLGSGLNAFFTLETSVGADSPTPTSLGDRTSIVGLSTSNGSIALGRDKHSVVRLLDNFDSMGNVYGSSADTIHAEQDSRVENATFLSAVLAKGVKINYQYSNSETAGVKSTHVGGFDLSLNDIFSASYARYDNRSTSVSDVVGAKFKIASSDTTLFGIYSRDKVIGIETEGKSIGINQKLGGNLVALASYGRKQGVKAINAGLTYNFSKRTMLHARIVDQNADDNANDVRRYGLGIEHNF